MTQKLFAVMLGGRAPKANTELHDVVFVRGTAIQDTYDQLLDKWFGTPESLHIDSWIELDAIDGWKIALAQTPALQSEKLFFVNLGGYNDAFTELHACGFYVASTPEDAKARAKADLLPGAVTVHKDDLHDVDDCLRIESAGGSHVTLIRTGETSAQKPNNGYHAIPKPVIAAWRARG